MAAPRLPAYTPPRLSPAWRSAWRVAWQSPCLDLPRDLLHAERRAIEDEECVHVVPRRLELAGEAGVQVAIAGVGQVQGYLRVVMGGE